MTPANVLAMTPAEFDLCKQDILNKGRPPGDFLLHRLLAIGLSMLHGYIKDAKYRQLSPKDFAPFAFPVETPEQKAKKHKDMIRGLALQAAKNGRR